VIETPIGTPPDKLPAFAGLKLIHPEVCDHAIPESSPVTGSIFTPEDEGAKLTHPISFPHAYPKRPLSVTVTGVPLGVKVILPYDVQVSLWHTRVELADMSIAPTDTDACAFETKDILMAPMMMLL
jgi:hypothetical protein